MNLATIKRGTVLVLAGAALAYGGNWYGARSHTPAMAAVSSSGCNIAQPAAGLTVPAALLSQSAAGLAVTYGPIEAAGLGAPFRITFDPAVDGTAREVAMTGDTLMLPALFGRTPVAPERISLTCRDGQVATVRYSSGRAAASTFNVVQADPLQAMEEEIIEEVAEETGG